MVKKQLILTGVIAILLLSGCATPLSISINASSIKYSDGVDEREAKYIAQKYCLDQGIKDTFISFPLVEEYIFNRGQWKVTLQKKNLSQFDYHYTLFIDKETGRVIDFRSEE